MSFLTCTAMWQDISSSGLLKEGAEESVVKLALMMAR